MFSGFSELFHSPHRVNQFSHRFRSSGFQRLGNRHKHGFRSTQEIARSVRHFLEVLDQLNHLEIKFVSFRENFDTGGRLGRAVVIIIAELERNLIIERVRQVCAVPGWKASISAGMHST